MRDAYCDRLMIDRTLDTFKLVETITELQSFAKLVERVHKLRECCLGLGESFCESFTLEHSATAGAMVVLRPKPTDSLANLMLAIRALKMDWNIVER